jgi:serine/threonine-protein kinase HipA
VNGTGSPTLKDVTAVGAKVRISKKRCMDIVAEVEIACKDIAKFGF